MITPKQIIEDIRKNTYGIGLQTDKVAQGVIDNFRISLNNALERLSLDLYSKETHFVLELIQNADDNQYQNGVTPTLTLTIDQGKIIVQNNEVGFNEDNVRAICNVGRSTKTKIEGYIGEKGIGFKSVFRISDKPQIFPHGFKFHFQRQNDENQLGFVTPYNDELQQLLNKEYPSFVTFREHNLWKPYQPINPSYPIRKKWVLYLLLERNCAIPW